MVTCKPIARKFLDEITIADVKSVLQPYWNRGQLDSASSLRKRIEAILDYATAHGWRSGDNPASWNIFKHLWPGEKVQDVHHAALPWREAPEFFQRLRQSEATSARLLEFIVLTAVRSNEAAWRDLVGDRPGGPCMDHPGGAHVKMHRDHDVPLKLSRRSPSCAEWKPRRPAATFVFVGGRDVSERRGGWQADAQRQPCMDADEARRRRRNSHTGSARHSCDWCVRNRASTAKLAERRHRPHSVGSDAENAYARSCSRSPAGDRSWKRGARLSTALATTCCRWRGWWHKPGFEHARAVGYMLGNS